VDRGVGSLVEERPPATTPVSARIREIPALAFNQQDAAAALGISVDHFERHVKPHLPVVYAGSLRLYPRTMLERWLEGETVFQGRRLRLSRSR
jgi:hypothetical protein